tara:strand:+ start:223 stop:366 length:144 start_codon:yes stop_codon:yes gene_type:complete
LKKYLFKFSDTNSEFTVSGYNPSDAKKRARQLFVDKHIYLGEFNENT